MAELFQLSLDDLGRILIPDSLRSHLRLVPGMTLIVERGENGGLRLRLQSPFAALADKGGILVLKAVSAGNLNDLTCRERDERVFNLLLRAGL